MKERPFRFVVEKKNGSRPFCAKTNRVRAERCPDGGDRLRRIGFVRRGRFIVLKNG